MGPPLALSPDGEWLAFTGPDHRPGLRRLADGAVTTLPIEGVAGLRWSTDSTRLAVVSGGGQQLWEVAAGTKTARNLLNLPTGGLRWVGFPDYFPDGDLLVSGRDEVGRFSLIRVQGPNRWQALFTGREPLTGPRVSPDGTRAAVLVGPPGETALWVIDLKTGVSRAVVPAPAENPVWAPNGRALAFERPTGTSREVQVIDPDGHRPEAAGSGAFPGWVGGELRWVGTAGQLMARVGASPAAILLETGLGEVQFAAWGGDGRVVLYHRGGLTLADVKARSVNSLQRAGFGALAGEPGQVQAAGNFGIPSTGYVSDVFRPGHPALDIARPFNVPESQAPIVAAYPGRVVWAGDAWSGPYGGYGNLIIIDHGYIDGVHVATYYAHWRTKYVNVGDFVWTGWRLADQSDYGWATGVHLHFEVREGGTPTAWRPYFDGTPVDPTGPRYLNRPLRVGDYVVAATPAALFRVLMPLAGR
jgi:murein DD-endopeptidase MepM/ murein hydrolase activator NlpD